jgi:hypothetical protein
MVCMIPIYKNIKNKKGNKLICPSFVLDSGWFVLRLNRLCFARACLEFYNKRTSANEYLYKFNNAAIKNP